MPIRLVPLLVLSGICRTASMRTHKSYRSHGDELEEPSWEERITKCAAQGTPWKGMEKAAARSGANLGHVIRDSVRERIAMQGLPMQQGREGMCGPTTIGNIFTVMSSGQEYANVIADLFCTGATSRFTKRVAVPEDLLACEKSASSNQLTFACNAGNKINEVVGITFDDDGRVQSVVAQGLAHTAGITNGDRILNISHKPYSKANLHEAEQSGVGYTVTFQIRRMDPYGMPDGVNEKKTNSVDWIWASAMYAESSAWYSVFSSTCGGNQVLGQSVTPSNLMSMARFVFPDVTVKVYGHYLNHLVSKAIRVKHHLKKDTWEKVLRAVEAGGQAALMVSMEPNGLPNHFVTLTQVLDNSSFADNACASRILSRNKACIIWTWASYYIFESCEHLRKLTSSAVTIMHPNQAGKIRRKEIKHAAMNLRFLQTKTSRQDVGALISRFSVFGGLSELRNPKYAKHLNTTQWQSRALLYKRYNASDLSPAISYVGAQLLGAKQVEAGYRQPLDECKSWR